MLTSGTPTPPAPGTRREFVYDSSKPLEGVIAHLTRECGGNVHDKGIVNVTGSGDDMEMIDISGGSFSVSGCCNQAKNAVDLGTDSLYLSYDEDDSWICYDFKDRRVIPTSYSVRSCGHGVGGEHLKSWVIEVSNDESSWIEIDRRDNNNDLHAEYATANFTISNVPSESFRFFRLRQTGPNHCSWTTSLCLTITSLEVFGTLLEK